MRLACGECGRRFSTTDDPVPGHVYGIPCRCGTTIIVHLDARDRLRPPPLPPRRSKPGQSAPPTAANDPFALATMDALSQESLAATPEPMGPPLPPLLVPREPTYAERDGAPESAGWYALHEARPETARATWLAGTRAMLLDAVAAVRGMLGAGPDQTLRYRLVAGGAVLGAVAFGLGVWVGAASTSSRGQRTTAAVEARTRAGATTPATVAALGPVAVPVAGQAPIATRDEAPSVPAPAAAPEALRRRSPHPVEPAALRPAASENPAVEDGPTTAKASASEATAAGRPAAVEAPPAEEPGPVGEPARLDVAPGDGPAPAPDAAPDRESAQPADRVPQGGEPAMTGPSEQRPEPTGEPTLTASVSPASDVAPEASPAPADPTPGEPLPAK